LKRPILFFEWVGYTGGYIAKKFFRFPTLSFFVLLFPTMSLRRSPRLGEKNAAKRPPTYAEEQAYADAITQFIELTHSAPPGSHERVSFCIAAFREVMTSRKIMAYHPKLRTAASEALDRCYRETASCEAVFLRPLVAIDKTYNKFLASLNQEACYRA